MSSKSTEAEVYAFVPLSGINQREDSVTLDNKTLSSTDGLATLQTGSLERAYGKGTLAKYADAVWSIIQMWSPQGIVAGFSQYGGSLTYQPWKLTWTPVNTTIPAWLPIDPNTGVTYLQVPNGYNYDSTSTNSSSGVNEGSGSSGKWHWEYVEYPLTIVSSVPYRDPGNPTTTGPTEIRRVPETYTLVLADAPAYNNPTPSQVSNGTSGFSAADYRHRTASLGNYNAPSHTYGVRQSTYVSARYNMVTINIPHEGAEIKLTLKVQTANGVYAPDKTLWVSIPQGINTINTLDFLPTPAPFLSSAADEWYGQQYDIASDFTGKYRVPVKVKS